MSESTIIGEIEGCEIELAVDDAGNETVFFLSDADIDNDGSGGNPEHDPCFQNNTSLHGPDGQPLNAETVPFVVVPPLILQKTRGHVLGSLCIVSYNGRQIKAVVGDIGPHHKLGEISVATARALNINPDPKFGGEPRRIVRYEIHVGLPAVVNGVTYQLKAS